MQSLHSKGTFVVAADGSEMPSELLFLQLQTDGYVCRCVCVCVAVRVPAAPAEHWYTRLREHLYTRYVSTDWVMKCPFPFHSHRDDFCAVHRAAHLSEAAVAGQHVSNTDRRQLHQPSTRQLVAGRTCCTNVPGHIGQQIAQSHSCCLQSKAWRASRM